MPDPVMADFFHAMIQLDASAGGDADDRYNWNLFFRNDGVGDADYAADHIASRLQSFLDFPLPTFGFPVSALLPKYVPRAQTVRVYDLGQATPRTPHVRDLTLSEPTAGVYSTPLPPEVAVRLTTRALSAPNTAGGVSAGGKVIRPRRRTGGFYFGPLMVNALEASNDGRGRVRDILRTGIADACAQLASDSALHPFKWVLLSKGLATAWPITDGFVNDEFDTQRKRGTSGSTRTEWVAA